jgi:hypothetical protein
MYTCVHAIWTALDTIPPAQLIMRERVRVMGKRWDIMRVAKSIAAMPTPSAAQTVRNRQPRRVDENPLYNQADSSPVE